MRKEMDGQDSKERYTVPERENPDVFGDGFIEETARRHGVPEDNPGKVKDVLKAASQVSFENLPENKLPKGLPGKFIEAAVRVETVAQNLPLNPKQREFAKGLEENFKGAAGFFSAIGEKAEKFFPKEKGNIARKAATSLLVAQMALSACNPVNSPQTPETLSAQPPAQTEIYTPTPAEPTPTFTPTPTETFMPTPTQTETATATPTEARTAAEETSRYFQPEFQLDLEGTVDGITIPYTLGLHKSVVERAEEPIKTISVNREDAPDLYAKFWLTICWQKYLEQHPNDAKITFAQYEDLVKNGEGEIEVAAVDENTDDQNNKILTFHPEKGFVSIFVDKSITLPEDGNTLFSFYFGMNRKGQLIIADNSLWSDFISGQRPYSGYEGWTLDNLIGLVVSVYVAERLEMVISTNNAALISQRPYWKEAGQVSPVSYTHLT
ncbi:MAG: hypothetical protein QUS12_02910, partial [Methanosarcina sp.]|nr:hypothetical protein [Methanosarcina sp.]